MDQLVEFLRKRGVHKNQLDKLSEDKVLIQRVYNFILFTFKV